MLTPIIVVSCSSGDALSWLAGCRAWASAISRSNAAAREGITGTVRNLDDGRVEIVAEGDAEAVTRFERSLRQGPVGARVDDVLVGPRAGHPDAFTTSASCRMTSRARIRKD